MQDMCHKYEQHGSSQSLFWTTSSTYQKMIHIINSLKRVDVTECEFNAYNSALYRVTCTVYPVIGPKQSTLVIMKKTGKRGQNRWVNSETLHNVGNFNLILYQIAVLNTYYTYLLLTRKFMPP